MGIIGNGMKLSTGDGAAPSQPKGCCEDSLNDDPRVSIHSFRKDQRGSEVRVYYHAEEIGAQILLGIAVASLVVASTPIQYLIKPI